MGSEEAKEKAEFGREQRKRGPSTKQIEAAEASELDQQQEAAERKKRKKAPAKSAVEIAELSVGTVGSEFELNQWHRRQRVRAQTLRLNSAKQKANAPPEQTAAKTGQDKKEHDKYCHFCQVWPTACAFPGEPALL